jgi:hypothetical protein
LTGLDPVIHDFSQQFVDPRNKSGGGDWVEKVQLQAIMV